MLRKRYISVLCFGILFCLLHPAWCADTSDDALLWYHKGVSAKTYQERIDAFEKSLELYMVQYNQQKAEDNTNAFLCYNIGNCYFNLKQVGQAVFYYKMGLKLMPYNELIAENLKTALEKRTGAIDVKRNDILETLLFFHYKISTRNRITLLICLSVVMFLFYLPAIFRQHTLSRYMSLIMFSLSVLVASSLGVEYYSPQYEGVVVNSSYARKDAGDAFSPITPDPLGEGSIVRILSLENNWMKVEIGEGKKGYIKKDDLKVII